MTINRGLLTSKEQHFGTPDEIFSRLHGAFRFTTDACATEKDTKLPHFVPPNGDGKNYSWDRLRPFSNPEYRFCSEWVPKARNESLNGQVISASLVPYRPDPEWWNIGALSEDGEAGPLLKSLYDPKNRVLWLRFRHLITGIHSVPDRLKFVDPKRKLKATDKAGTAPFPSAVIIHITPGLALPTRRWLLERCPK